MAEKEPFIHLFHTEAGYYLFDVNRNTILRIAKDVYTHLKGNHADIDNKAVSDAIEKIRCLGYLSSNRIKEIVHSSNDSLESILQNKLRMITLQITQQCNLRCKYCPYSGGYENRLHTNKKMSFETAKKGIDFLFNHSSNSKRVAIGFYGGEPLLEFDLVKDCIEYSKEKAEGKELLYTLTTNGTLIDSSVIKYLSSNHVSLLISLDGPKNVHDKNRRFAHGGGGSFDTVIKNLENVKREFPDYFNKVMFNAVMDPTNDFSCVNEFFASYEVVKELGAQSSVINQFNLKKEIESSDDFSTNYMYEIFKIMLSKLGKLDSSHTSKLLQAYYSHIKRTMYDARLTRADSLPERCHPGGPCIPGASRLFIDIKGDFYPCERVSESSNIMKIGNIDSGFDLEKCRSLLNIGKITETSCKNCWAFRFCTLCCASADNSDSLSAEKRRTYCESTKNQAENMLLDYCVMNELGHTFREKENQILFETI